MTSLALDIFHRLLSQVEELESAALRAENDGFTSSAPILRRSGFILTVAALDSYFHERAISLLHLHAGQGSVPASQVVSYVGQVTSAQVLGAQGESYIRLRLSFKTLVAPNSIDKLLTALDISPDDTWRDVALALNSRPDRQKRLLELLYDRRNQIAHEADWDVGRLDFRPMEKAHLVDCIKTVTELVEGFDKIL